MNKKKKRCIIIALALIAAIMAPMLGTVSERSLRNRVVKLKAARGSCSGEQVRAPSGESFILSAGHCSLLADASGSITVELESGAEIQRKIIAEDPKSDLLLIEGIPGMRGIDIAKSAGPGTLVRTFTHGAGYKTYKTSGELVQESHLNIFFGEGACPSKAPKFKEINIEIFPGLILSACLLSVTEMTMTAMIVPGSSGGMVVDSAGALVGVVSAGDGKFGQIVLLSDIQAFLAGY